MTPLDTSVPGRSRDASVVGRPKIPLLPYEEAILRRERAALPPKEWRALQGWLSRLWPFQRQWVLDPSVFAICLKARQVGTSLSTAGTGAFWGAFWGETTTIVSIGQDEANEVLDKARRHARVLQDLGSEWANTVRSNKEEIVFESGGRVIALDSKGARSYSGNVFLDEYAYHPHATAVWDASVPATLLGDARIRVVSTPNGVGNEFHDLWEHATKPTRSELMPPEVRSEPWSAHHVPIHKAIGQGYPVDLGKCWGMAKNDPRLFSQFFECSFLDSVYQYLPTELLMDRLIATPPGPGEHGSTYFAGLDIGREVDLSVLFVIRQDVIGRRVKLRPVHVETMKRLDPEGLESMVAAAFAKYKIKRLAIDSTGIGSAPGITMKKRHSERYDPQTRRPRVELVDFGLKSKEAMATGLYEALTSGTLDLPESDAALPTFERVDEKDGSRHLVNEPGTAALLRRELASLQRRITKSANVVYETPRTREGHADRAWALMLACHAVDPPHPMVLALRGGRVA